VFIEGRLPERSAAAPIAMTNRFTDGYLQAMGTRLIRGRDFNERDDDKAPRVVIINETFAREFWPDEEPLGKRFSIGSAESTKREVVGVVQDGKYAGLTETPKPFFARPFLQAYSGSNAVVVRGTSDPELLISMVRSEVKQMDPQLPISSRTMLQRMDFSLLPVRLAASISGGFGLLALALSAIGIYGIMAYAVAKRTRELGIRMALGAQKGDVLRLVLSQTMRLTLIGVAVGLVVAFAVTRLMASALFGVNPGDPITYGAVTVLLGLVAVLACWIPARRATLIDPTVALRSE
jgi:predicted permease